MLSLRKLIRRLRSVQSGEEEGLRRGADNVDAMAATRSGSSDPGSGMPAGIPPNYIKTYDEGRPRH
jgi:hypothetical protein